MGRVRTTLLVAATDLRRRLRNRTFVVQGIVGPILLAGIISLAFASDDISATIGVVDADGSPIATGFVSAVTDGDDGGLRFERVATPEAARDAVAADDLGAAVVVPEGFAASLATGDPADLEVVTSSDDTVAAEVARSVANGLTDRANAARLAVATTAALGAPPPGAEELAAIDLPLRLEVQGTGGELSPAAYFGPGMGLLFLFLSVGAVARDLLAERRTGLLDRLRAGPVRDSALLAGKALSVTAIGVTSLTTIWVVTSLAMGADWGDPVGVALLIGTAALAVAGVAGVVAGLSRNEETADSLSTVVGLVFALVGGAFIPLGAMPDALQRLALLTPTGWALRGFAELSAGGGSTVDVVPHALVLVGWGVVAGAVATRLLPRRLGAV